MRDDDLQVWVESHSVFPSECFASVRLVGHDQAIASPPCKLSELHTCLGDVRPEDGPIVVDIFQRITTVDCKYLGINAPVLHQPIKWPGVHGIEELKLSIGLLTRKDAPARGVPDADMDIDGSKIHMPPSLSGAMEAIDAIRESSRHPSVDHGTDPLKMPDMDVDMSMGTPEVGGRITSNVDVASPAKSPALGNKSPRATNVPRPIVLNNCDQIIPYLYLGGVAAASDTTSLVQQGIRAVCCCVRELEFPTREFSKQVEYYRVDVEDVSREPIELFFPEATEFINQFVSKEMPVLVHCRAGVSRSASTVIAYLIRYQNYSLHDAFFLARSRRSIVTPNIGFMEKLTEYEEEVRGVDATIDLNKYISWYETPVEGRAAVPALKPD